MSTFIGRSLIGVMVVLLIAAGGPIIQKAAGQGRGGGGAGRGGAGQGTPVTGPDGEVWGFSDTAFNPDTRWRIHDPDRPQPPAVTPGETVSIPAPSDAIVLFDGRDLSQWVSRGPGGVEAPAAWTIRDGYFEAQGGTLSTRESFGDVQLHMEYAIPENVLGASQNRGNGGVIFMGRYEIQILDSYDNRTYADGMMASIYGEWPPLVNASRKPGEWQSLDIVFEAPRFAGRVTPGYFTVFWNGVVVHNRTELYGTTTATMTPHAYTAHDPELPLQLQGRAPVRYRNVWIRRLAPYDQGTDRN
jgi:3-keto-disaccharide hydrolase